MKSHLLERSHLKIVRRVLFYDKEDEMSSQLARYRLLETTATEKMLKKYETIYIQLSFAFWL